MNLVVIGSQWGDEGKGKIVDYLAPKYDAIVRFNGGNNAGHTVVADDKTLKLSLLPSGVLHDKKLFICQGVVIDPEVLLKEINFFPHKLNLTVDYRCHAVMPYHKDLDAATEARRGAAKVGSLHLGIGYCYSDRTNRQGIRLEDLVDKNKFYKILQENYPVKKAIIEKVYGGIMSLSLEQTYEIYSKYGQKLKEYTGDAAEKLNSPPMRRILFEGAQGTFLDMAFGTYPYTVGCHTLAGSVFDGAGIGIQKMRVLAVIKAYTTRVGGGPFLTEQDNEIGEYLRDRGGEYGTVSKRPRRCGWLDLSMIKNAAKWNGFTELAITKLDVLTGLKEIKVCTALQNNKSRYQIFKGWQENISRIRCFSDLPQACQKYLNFLRNEIKVPIKYVSVGPEREQTINN